MQNNKKKEIIKGKLSQMQKGMKIETEHGTKHGEKYNVTNDNPKLTAKIAAVHIKEVPDYYSRLEEMEKEGKENISSK
jgi:hypothetical protein